VRKLLPAVLCALAVAAFALTEPEAGSDAASISTTASKHGSSFVIDGVKTWISFGAIADVFLVMTKVDGADTAFLVPRKTAGLEIAPINDMAGLRGSMLARITFRSCRVPETAMLGRVGGGLVFVATTALMLGRYSTAWGCVGLARHCLEASVRYARSRAQFGRALSEHQLVQSILARMETTTAAARALCLEAGIANDTFSALPTDSVLQAKYFASRAASEVAADAVQLHGAHGVGPESPVARASRDARVAEIIEGTSQVLEVLIADGPLANHPLDRS
jgi:alkylation response protein AidB-like acyl-CoA dehydrogenase